MYLIIDRGGCIVAITPQISYVETQANGSTALTDESAAASVYAAANDTFYRLREIVPGDKLHRVEEVASVPEGVPADCLRFADGELTIDLDALRAKKAAELSGDCYEAITGGCDVILADGSTGHFALEETDQINITAAAQAIAQGAAGYPYHADGQLCRLFSAADIATVATAATRHKLYHTTYCNHLLTWARREETAEGIASISYGAELPEDLAANMAEVLTDAEGS